MKQKSQHQNAFGTLETAIAAIRSGAYDFITKPIEMDLLSVTLRRAIERHRLTQQIRLLESSHRREKNEIIVEDPPVLRKSEEVSLSRFSGEISG